MIGTQQYPDFSGYTMNLNPGFQPSSTIYHEPQIQVNEPFNQPPTAPSAPPISNLYPFEDSDKTTSLFHKQTEDLIIFCQNVANKIFNDETKAYYQSAKPTFHAAQPVVNNLVNNVDNSTKFNYSPVYNLFTSPAPQPIFVTKADPRETKKAVRKKEEMSSEMKVFWTVIGGLGAFGGLYFVSKYFGQKSTDDEVKQDFNQLKSQWNENQEHYLPDYRSAIHTLKTSTETILQRQKISHQRNIAIAVGIIAAGALMISGAILASEALALSGVVVAIVSTGCGIAHGAFQHFDKRNFNTTNKIYSAIQQINNLKEKNRVFI